MVDFIDVSMVVCGDCSSTVHTILQGRIQDFGKGVGGGGGSR